MFRILGSVRRPSSWGMPVHIAAVKPQHFPRNAETRWGAYAQDVWRVNRKLTVNLGLRWDKFTPIRPHFNGYIANFDPESGDMFAGGLGSVPSSTSVYTPNTDFAPRVGIAYKVTNKTVLRAGLGRSYFESGYNATFATLCCQYPILTNQTISQTSEYSSIFPLSQGPPPPPAPEFPSTGMLPAPNITQRRAHSDRTAAGDERGVCGDVYPPAVR